MSSLLVLQNKDSIIMTSDTASSIKIDEVYYRVSNDESKIFEFKEYTIFASGNKLIRDIFISMLNDNDDLNSIQDKLINKILNSCNEYSLEVVVSSVGDKQSIVSIFSSYNDFKRVDSIVNNDETHFFSAGIKTKEIYSSFEKNIQSYPLIEAIKNTYKENSCEEIGGSIDVYQLSNKKTKHKRFNIDIHVTSKEILSKNPYIYLIVGERIYGKIISGVNLAIEDASGIWKTQGSRTTIYDRFGNPQMKLGLVTEAPNPECFGMLLDNGKHRVHVTSCEGFMIEKKENGDWVKKMYADLEGNFWVKDFTAQNLTVIDDDGYFKFEGNKGSVSDGNDKVMWFGYIPYGSVPYCNPSEDFGITLKGINNSLIYMTKTRGFAIDVDCINKFRVDTDGYLYAQDIVTHNLKIVNGELGEKIILDENDGITINGNDGEQIRLNANEGISIDVNGDNRFWIGKDGFLYARKLFIMNDELDESILEALDPNDSFISDLTVTRLRTLDMTDQYNYVHVKHKYLRLMTRYDLNDPSSEKAKFELGFEGTGVTSYPKTTWGTGDPNGLDKGYIYKDSNTFTFMYDSPNGDRIIKLNETDTNDAGQAIYIYAENGGIRLDAKTRTVMRTAENKYVRVIDNEDVAMRFGEASVTINSTEIRLQWNSSNFISISANGVDINGTRIDLN